MTYFAAHCMFITNQDTMHPQGRLLPVLGILIG